VHILGRLLRFLLSAAFGLVLLGAAGGVAVMLYLAPRLPDSRELRGVELQEPLRVYARDGTLLAEFGEKRRIPVQYDAIPPQLIQAVLASEDDRFFEHPGVDYQGLLRAALMLLATGEKQQGGSTITMQVARNFFLSSEKTYLRKLTEILLALKIERELDKRQILELYLNKIYLGQRAYGVAAAAQIYYGRTLTELSLAQMAMLAGLPKAPSRDNPVSNPERARARRDYVLGRMHELGMITAEVYQAARSEADDARLTRTTPGAEAPHLAEMVRADLVTRYGEAAAYDGGLRVTTTLDTRQQGAATKALRAALAEYDRRHGYRGAERRVNLDALSPDAWDAELAQHTTLGGLAAALVTGSDEAQGLRVVLHGGETLTLPAKAVTWAGNRRPRRGDIVRIERRDDGAHLAQLPAVEGALTALDPQSGALRALVGGFDFRRSKFNRVTQALRQPGSSFKPFIYSAALEAGYTPASLINDAPLTIEDHGRIWRPENYDGEFHGPTRLRTALAQSRNLISVRLLQDLGARTVINHAAQFGFDTKRLPPYLTLALGVGEATPLEMARAFAVFANGGFRVTPWYIERITDRNGATLFQAEPELACTDCTDSGNGAATATALPISAARAPRAISAENAYLMTSLLREVVNSGTGKRALALKRGDLAGKTGTTNDERDAWFSGYNDALVATAWVGFDDHRPLGKGETGGRAALPMWIGLMGEALAGVPEHPLAEPPGIITARIDPATGALATAATPDARFEIFMAAHPPGAHTGPDMGAAMSTAPASTEEPLF
jgi:penicillin-binding protein 1A